jgi:putative endonuclease
MAEHNILGKSGEEEAIRYLVAQGYAIRHQNWRRGHKEIDIVAEKDSELIIVEVKTRKNRLFAEPHDAVTPMKIRRTVSAADAYLRFFQVDLPVRFDIITVVGEAGSFAVEHIEEAFYPPVW